MTLRASRYRAFSRRWAFCPNRAVQAARAALDVARRALEGLERAAVAGRRWVSGLARGVGAQIAGEREERARLAEVAVQEQVLWTARAGQVLPPGPQTPSPGPAATQSPPDAGRKAGVWGEVEDVGRKAREADRARQGPDHERPSERQGPRM